MRAQPPSRVDPLIFFLDRSLGKHIVADALRQAEAAVEVHDDHFRQDARDEAWLRTVGERGWIVLTRDDRIRYRVHERTALFQAEVRAFVLVRRSLSGPAMAEAFVRPLPAMRRFVATHQAPFVARVTQTGSVSLQEFTHAPTARGTVPTAGLPPPLCLHPRRLCPARWARRPQPV